MQSRTLFLALSLGFPVIGSSATAGTLYFGFDLGASSTSVDRAQILTSLVAPFPPPPGPPVSIALYDSFEADENVSSFASVGTEIAKSIRVELELGYRNADLGPIELTQKSAMLNAAYDIPIVDQIQLSLGGGVGFDAARIETLVLSDDALELAYQLTAELSYGIGDGLSVNLKYRYFTAPDTQLGADNGLIGDTIVDGIADSTVTVGARFGF